MRGFKSNAVQELKRILKDQYSPHSIIKELIQNSDDAKSSMLHIGWIPNAPPNTHPLLNSPAIVVLNNGEFLPNDAKAICRLTALYCNRSMGNKRCKRRDNFICR